MHGEKDDYAIAIIAAGSIGGVLAQNFGGFAGLLLGAALGFEVIRADAINRKYKALKARVSAE